MSFPFKFNEIKITKKVNLGNYEGEEFGLSISPLNVSNADISIKDTFISVEKELSETIVCIISGNE